MANPVKVYLAARYSRYPEMQTYASDLEAAGYVVVSRWIRGNHDYPTEQMEDAARAALRGEWALEDWDDVRSADVVISFTEEPKLGGRNRGGRHVEFGAALALGKRCLVVGPRENVFHCLADVEHFPDWLAAFKQLMKEAATPLPLAARRPADGKGGLQVNG